ncbi:hypothetical protein AVEN_129547-1, partial [Araneus ventricosus]
MILLGRKNEKECGEDQ